MCDAQSLVEEEARSCQEQKPPEDPQIAKFRAMITPMLDRSPARSEELIIPMGSMDTYFKSLAMIEDGASHKVSRALVWGDSTIASDGVIKNVRKRMQSRFGDAGPGFIPVQVDPRWSMRKDILRKYSSNWKTHTIVFGGGPKGKYGLSGMVSSTHAKSWATIY